MKRILIGVLLAGVCSGCASMPVEDWRSTETAPMTRRFISLLQVKNGMRRNEVSSLLGKEVVIGYELTDAAAGQYKPITASNPHRTETIQKKNADYVIDYYLVGIKTADDRVTDDELVPLAFQNDKLVGSGWDFVNQKIKSP